MSDPREDPKQLLQRVSDLERALTQYAQRLEGISRHVHGLDERVFWEWSLFSKAFAVAGLDGDFVEFGVWQGRTLADAYWSAYRHAEQFLKGTWDHAMTSATKEHVLAGWNNMRFIGFDTFTGIPEVSGVDAERPVYIEGSFSASKEVPLALFDHQNVPRDRVRLVEGRFEDSCNDSTAAELDLRSISVVHIDSDLYSSAATALEFCTPYLRNGSVVIFDEWFQFGGSPEYGEQRAWSEWLERHPEIQTTELAREGFGRIAFIITNVDETAAGRRTTWFTA